MQIYIPPHREEIAMEPQSGGADAYRFHQYGLQRLKPGESFNYACQIAVEFS
jgi:galactose mutarotase-like enzyme